MEDHKIKQLLASHKGYTESLENLLRTILKAKKIKFHLIESRTKDFDSLKEKVERKNILDIEADVTDLSGIRIILYYQNDIELVEKLIEDNFVVDEANSMNKAESLAKNEFGYLSVHYIVQTNQEREALAEWEMYKSLKAEIQVRTILQHSWAAISHEMIYKRREDMPPKLERKLYRLAGLFELADEQFELLKSKDEQIEKEYSESIRDKNINSEPLNNLSLKAEFESENSQIKSLVELGYQSGFEPSTHDIYKEELSKIILACQILKIDTFSKLFETLNSNAEKLKSTLEEMLGQTRNGKWLGSYSYLTMVSLMLSMDDHELELYRSQILYAPSLWQMTKDAVANNR